MGWNHEKHLDMFLPKLQGPAGDYVFDELSLNKHSNYKVLTKCQQHRFHKVKMAKTYVIIFCILEKRSKVPDTEDTYVNELKCIYHKAYLQYDCSA